MPLPGSETFEQTSNNGGWTVRLCLAYVTACGFFATALMPVVITGLETSLRLAPAVAAAIAASGTYGTALGAFGTALCGPRGHLRAIALPLIALLVLFDLASAAITAPATLVALRFLHGCCGGVLMGLGYAAIGRDPQPQRGFAALLVIQFAVAMVGTSVLPWLIGQAGAPGLFVPLALLAAMALPLLRVVADTPLAGGGGSSAASPRGSLGSALVALAVVLLFESGHTMISGFALDIGRRAGHRASVLGPLVGIAAGAGILGALLAAMPGRYPAHRSALYAAIIVTLLCIAALFRASSLPLFVAALALGTIAWAYAVPQLLGDCIRIGGLRAAAWASLVAKLGLGSGPLIASTLIVAGDFSQVFAVAVIVNLLALIGVSLRPALTTHANETRSTGPTR